MNLDVSHLLNKRQRERKRELLPTCKCLSFIQQRSHEIINKLQLTILSHLNTGFRFKDPKLVWSPS